MRLGTCAEGTLSSFSMATVRHAPADRNLTDARFTAKLVEQEAATSPRSPALLGVASG